MFDSKIGAEIGKILAQLLDFLALLRRKIETGPAIIPQRFLQQLCVFAAQLRLGFFESLDRLVNILAIVDADRPILEKFDRILGGCAHGGGSIGFLDDGRLVRGEPGLVTEIVERDDRALKSDFRQILFADLVERRVCFRDRVFHRSIDGFGRLFPIWKRQKGVGFRGGVAKGFDGLESSSARAVMARPQINRETTSGFIIRKSET